eukprot:TRINITY_DN4443_c0_g1_i1.p3 TRINITY_DN4443_c0_g1~~TRINITY_DN4443_c0_g1_i1.p3  ORF type:complete len:191 (-),score=37.74 TRINITY_DN4443_c0_g1_i1:43-615(-)
MKSQISKQKSINIGAIGEQQQVPQSPENEKIQNIKQFFQDNSTDKLLKLPSNISSPIYRRTTATAKNTLQQSGAQISNQYDENPNKIINEIKSLMRQTSIQSYGENLQLEKLDQRALKQYQQQQQQQQSFNPIREVQNIQNQEEEEYEEIEFGNQNSFTKQIPPAANLSMNSPLMKLNAIIENREKRNLD